MNGTPLLFDRFCNPVCGVSLLGVLLFLNLSFLGFLTAEVNLFEPVAEGALCERLPVPEKLEPGSSSGGDCLNEIQFLRDPVCKRLLSRRQNKNGFSTGTTTFFSALKLELIFKFLLYPDHPESHFTPLQLANSLFIRAGPSCRC